MEPRSLVVVENEPGAGLEMFQGWLQAAGVRLELCRPHAGDPLPPEPPGGGLIVLGGAMGACDDDVAPWLSPLRELLARATGRSSPVLGICLGAQLLAAACGGTVGRSTSGGEFGLCTIRLEAPASDDPLFSALPPESEVVQWHADEITALPRGALLLASGRSCRVQAFRVGECAWGVQFHPEVNAAVLGAWLEEEPRLAPARREVLLQAIGEVSAAEEGLVASSRALAEEFARVVLSR